MLRLKSRFAQPTFLWTRRILERLQAVQNKQGSSMRDKLRQSLAFLPSCSDPWIWISKPRESDVKKIHLRTKNLPLSPACRRTNRKRAEQNGTAQQPAVGANG
jgi:hypothetical protein